jgi:hypothetical protein
MLDPAPLAFDQGMTLQARTGGAVGMAHHDGTAVDIEPVSSADDLYGDGFIQGSCAGVMDFQSYALAHNITIDCTESSVHGSTGSPRTKELIRASKD